MKKTQAVAIIISLMALFTFPGRAAEEGTDYMVLETPIPNADNTLIKVWNYSCPFCYKYDKSVTSEVVAKMPADLTFRPFHLKTKGTYGEQASPLFAVLMIIDQENGLTDRDLNDADKSLFKKVKMAYYDAYHEQKERWDSGADAFLQFGLDSAGLSKEDYEARLQTPEVQALLAEWDVAYDVAKIQGIPGFVVNGKYLIYTKSIRSIDGMVETITELKEM